ncbi:hypothetical protein PoB_002728200 [Plakobranchus ocellatus]|uniref:Uncharacterized protein n=1 Tax=Plakobranchus ocellatus TaxID=259542 RepID=A0AAV4A1N2_9GAST|nr:hypothetical protein PoB_002728200 [Plakobranchus ocellatus]
MKRYDLDRWIELSKTDKSYEKLKDLIVREQFMDACPEDLSTSLREKDLPTLERVAKEADLFLKARNRKLCDQPCNVFQGNARPQKDSVRPLEPEKRFNGDNVRGRRRRAWLTRGRASSARRPDIGLGTSQLLIVPQRRLVREWL